MVAADPVEPLIFVIGVFIVLVDPVLVFLAHPPGETVLLGVMFGNFVLRQFVAIGQVPGIGMCGGIVAVADRAAALENKRFVAFFAQLHGGIAAADTGANNNRVEVGFGCVVHQIIAQALLLTSSIDMQGLYSPGMGR